MFLIVTIDRDERIFALKESDRLLYPTRSGIDQCVSPKSLYLYWGSSSAKGTIAGHLEGDAQPKQTARPATPNTEKISFDCTDKIR